MGKVLIACEFSGVIRDAFIKAGHDAFSCDLLDSETPGPHIKGDCLDILNNGWDLMIAHPTCTYLCNSGVCRLTNKKTGVDHKRLTNMINACTFFNKLKDANIPRICIENPIPHKYARQTIGKYTQIVQPYFFGDNYQKSTCLWLKNLPKLVPTNIVPIMDNKIMKLGPSPDRWRERSRTPKGFGDAVAEQWGALI